MAASSLYATSCLSCPQGEHSEQTFNESMFAKLLHASTENYHSYSRSSRLRVATISMTIGVFIGCSSMFFLFAQTSESEWPSSRLHTLLDAKDAIIQAQARRIHDLEQGNRSANAHGSFEASKPHAPSHVTVLKFSSIEMNKSVCEEHTGGTCFWAECASYRHATCMRSWQSWGWHSCACPKGSCAAIDGTCHNHVFPHSFASWLRMESYSTFFMVLFLIGRSGLDGFLLSYTGLDRISSAHRKIKTRRLTKSNGELENFDELRQEQFPDDLACPYMPHLQTALVCAARLVFWHLLQPVFFLTVWFEYKELMGWWQYSFAAGVCTKEVYYMVLLALGIWFAPQFLLFAPFSADEISSRLLYFTSPDDFVAWALVAADSATKASWHGALGVIGVFVNIAGAVFSIIALALGMVNDGVMFPSLFFGYILSIVSPFGFFLFLKWGERL